MVATKSEIIPKRTVEPRRERMPIEAHRRAPRTELLDFSDMGRQVWKLRRRRVERVVGPIDV